MIAPPDGMLPRSSPFGKKNGTVPFFFPALANPARAFPFVIVGTAF